ncbi:fumarate reductase subunit FrdC [Morganella psychrotolerans]|uniref:fumarate reductase subunit FrdC n=1 Tax=Morganella psychrotolerans TaxID=368603 RepID=UPI0039B00805
MTTKRKPYVREMTPTWWNKLGFYRFYMVREGTAIVQLWFSLLVMYGVYCLKGGPADWAGYVHLLQNPVVVLINILTLAGTLLHTVTWFQLAPKAVNIVIKNEKMGPEPVVRGLWVVTIIVNAAILAVALL